MSGRAQLLQRSRQVKRRRKSIQVIGLVFLILITFVLTIYTLHRPRWRIQEVKVAGTESLNSDHLATLVKSELVGSYLWLVPKNSRLFFSKDTLAQEVSRQIPRIASLELDVSGTLLNVEITERESKLLWCLFDAVDTKDCYFVDMTGIAFAQAPTFIDHVLFEIHQKDNATSSASSTTLGSVVLAPAVLENIYDQKETVHKVLANKKMFDRSIITSVELVSGSYYSFDIVSPSLIGKQWRLLTQPKMSGQLLSERLSALFESESFDKNVIKNQQSLSYVDARLDSKLFFKVLDNHATTSP